MQPALVASIQVGKAFEKLYAGTDPQLVQARCRGMKTF